jgi:type II secretory pathway pseudopilin PulG
MDSKITSTKSKRTAAFTLPEVIIASGIGLLVLLVVVLTSFFASRSFVAMTNYVSMEQRSQLALDRMSKEIRQARRVENFTPTTVTIRDADNKLVTFSYDPDTRSMLRESGSSKSIYLTDCDSLEFSKYQRTTISNTFDAYEPAFVTNTRLIQVAWVCSRNILGTKANTESVQSSKIVIRNN